MRRGKDTYGGAVSKSEIIGLYPRVSTTVGKKLVTLPEETSPKRIAPRT